MRVVNLTILFLQLCCIKCKQKQNLKFSLKKFSFRMLLCIFCFKQILRAKHSTEIVLPVFCHWISCSFWPLFTQDENIVTNSMKRSRMKSFVSSHWHVGFLSFFRIQTLHKSCCLSKSVVFKCLYSLNLTKKNLVAC